MEDTNLRSIPFSLYVELLVEYFAQFPSYSVSFDEDSVIIVGGNEKISFFVPSFDSRNTHNRLSLTAIGHKKSSHENLHPIELLVSIEQWMKGTLTRTEQELLAAYPKAHTSGYLE